MRVVRGVPLLAALATAPAAWGFSLTGCSYQNTGADDQTLSSIYASLSKCHDACLSQYAFAIVQGDVCWCSNYAPASTVETTDCNTPCPGWPFEFCGAPDSSLFGYLALSKQPIGTMSASAAKSTSVRSPVLATATSFSAAATASSGTAAATTATVKVTARPETWTIPYASILTVQGGARTVTVTPTVVAQDPSQSDNSIIASPDQNSFWGNTGKVAGTFTVVGLIIAGVFAGAIFFFLRRRHHDDAMTVTSNEDGPTSSNGAPYMVDRRRSNLTLATAGLGAMTRGSSHDKSPTEKQMPTQSSRRGSIPMPYDQRLNPVALWNAHPNDSHVSVATFQDERDYSRPVLHVRNPDV